MEKHNINKRSRNSSSDSEDRITQERKRDRPADVTDDDGRAMATVFEDGASKALNEKLDSIVNGQAQLRTDLNNNFVKQSEQLARMIDTKLAGLRKEIDDKLEAITTELREVQTRVQVLESRDADAAAADGAQGIAVPELGEIRRRLDTLETSASQESLRARGSLIIKGLEEAAGETVEDLMQKCQQLLAQLQVPATIAATQRLGAAGQGRKPRLVAMSLAAHDDVKRVMRNKRRLKDIPEYASVYIEPMRPAELRNLEASIRRLAKEHPTLEYKRGRVQAKGAGAAQRTDANH